MDIVLGVSMTPKAVHMVLVEGENADGVTVDRDGLDSAGADPVEHVVAAVLGTRASAAQAGHILRSVGVAWTDHALAARLRQTLLTRGIDGVILVSELHAAGALAQAVGETVGYERTAVLFLECDTATLAVVRTTDGAVVRVDSRSLRPIAAQAGLREMVSGLGVAAEPPQAIFAVGSGVDTAELKPQLAVWSGLPVHAPEEGELAMARGAALASAATPRFETSTVGLAAGPAAEMGCPEHTVLANTAASMGETQVAEAAYMAPLGYSAVPDEVGVPEFVADEELDDSGRRPFLLIGSALSAVFVVGVAALAISLAVLVRPTADEGPDSARNPAVPTGPVPAANAGNPNVRQTIQAPIPVVQQAPRAVSAAPAPAAPGPVSAPVSAPEPAQAPVPAGSATDIASAAPAPAVPAPAVPPIIVPLPIPASGFPLLPSIGRSPVLNAPAPPDPATTASTASAPDPPSESPREPQTVGASPATTQTSAPVNTSTAPQPTADPTTESAAPSSADTSTSSQPSGTAATETLDPGSGSKTSSAESPAGAVEVSEIPHAVPAR